MKIRNFYNYISVYSLVSILLVCTANQYIKTANAAPVIQDATFIPPARFPQIINIFLYGGASELAGNLTNIIDINTNSQNAYTNPGAAGASIIELDDGNQPGQITRHGFWKDAGGDAMEDMLTGNGFGGAGNEMLSVYRTIFREKNNTQSHRQSVFSSQKGNLDIDNSGGVGTTIASVLFINKASIETSSLLGGRKLEEMVLPFVSFEGDSIVFSANTSGNPVNLPASLKANVIDTQFTNPYLRGRGVVGSNDQSKIDAIVDKTTAANNSRFSDVAQAFAGRAALEARIEIFSNNINNDALLPNIDDVNDPDRDPVTGKLVYPVGRFSESIKAAVTLAMQNPDSIFITLGGGTGGWDDHDNAIAKYTSRMNELMTTLRVAAKHIKFGKRFTLSNSGSPVETAETTDNIIINVHSDFGRNVNLNNSMGWDQGNNQSFYTIGGAGIRGQAALGKVVGKTERFGATAVNNQYTRPTIDSYKAEPMSIASSVYSYFGVQNPEVLTADAILNPQGDIKIDESIDSEPALF